MQKEFENILQICCEEFEVTVQEIKSKSRKQEIVFCRKAFCMIIEQNFNIKYEIIARLTNKKTQDICHYLSTQPKSRYYSILIERIKNRIKNQITF